MAFLLSVPDTLGALQAHGLPLRLACRNCGHNHDWDIATLLKRHGRHARWWDVKLRCMCCESYGADVQVTPLVTRLRIAA